MNSQSNQSIVARSTCLVAALVFALCGCSGFPAGDSEWTSFGKKPSPPPNRVTAIWTDTVLQQPGRPGVRGVGGRIMFYEVDDEEPIRVDGTLTVFAYDEEVLDANAVGATPARKYVFPAEDLEKHYSKSRLGHSYSFWLPWGETDGPPKQLSLIARFESKRGGAVLSEASKQLLPGAGVNIPSQQIAARSPHTTSTGGNDYAVQSASHAAANSIETKSKSMETITIDVPPEFARHAAAPPADVSRDPNFPALDQAREREALIPAARLPDDSQPMTRQVQTEDTLRQDAGHRRTRQRLEEWLSDRREKLKSD